MPSVVVGYDQSPSSELALEEAAMAAERRSGTLTVIHAYSSPPAFPPPFKVHDAEKRLRDLASRIVEQAADRIRSGHPHLTVHARAVLGIAGPLPAASVLAEAAADADLLVVGHRGHGGFPGLGLGSVAVSAVDRSSKPTLVVRGGRRDRRGAIVATVEVADAGAGADEVLGFAFAEADRRDAGLKAISAWEVLWPAEYFDDAELRQVADLARENTATGLARLFRPWRDKYPELTAECALVDGSPTAVLVEASAHADLMIVGAPRRRGPVHGVRLGPIADTLLRHADCPVAVVPYG
ncbi:MAG: universal stress protein [Streptomycetaceae bacterium]|nr:universal stress protein [Streptomycetaceae bacterium]